VAAQNPSYPAVIGPEWLPSVPRGYPIAKGQPSPVARVRSLAAENVGALRLGVGSNPAVTDRAFVVIDIYAEGSEGPQALSVSEFPPILDETIGNWTTNASGTVNLFARIDDAVVYPPSGTDYIRQIVGGASAYRCSVDSSGFSATARVLRVSVAAVIGLVALGSSAFVEIGIYHEPTATAYTPPGGIVYTNGLIPNAVQYIDCGEINPVTLLPWTPADIQSFDSGDWHLRFVGAGTGTNGPIVTAAALRVSFLPVENRVAVATWRRPAGAVTSPIATDALVPMPAGTGAWAAANATNYLYVPRIARDRLVGGSAPVASDITWLAAQQDLGASGNPAGVTSAPPAGPPAMQAITTDEHGLLVASFAATDKAAPRLVIRTTAPADSASSLPYLRDTSSVVVRSLHSGQQVGQRYTTSTGPRTYLGARFLVKPPTSADGTLTVRILRVSDSVQFGGTLVKTADEIRALPEIIGSGGFRYVEGFLDSGAVLANATQYEGQLIVTTPSTDPWKVIMMSAVGAGGQSFGGTTDFARLGTIAGGSSLTEQDLTLMFLEQPAAPATATAQVRAQQQDGDGCWCSVADVDQVEIDWAATALGVSFARYEIEREIDDGRDAGFEPVWTITTEATSIWWDYEMPMDRPVRYRVRVVTTASAFSDWRTTDWVVAESRKNEVVFTSNHNPALQVVYERAPDVDFDFLSQKADVMVPIFGGDYQVSFSDPNDRGVAETYDLTVQFGRQPSDNLGRPLNLQAVFQPLVDITRAAGVTIPYVCVRHRDGATIYGKVTLGTGRQRQPGNRWSVPATATPVSGVPIAGSSA
jgi:hypothetical protein